MSELKSATAKTLKWNTIDRLATQIIYAATGIILANILTKEEFGLVGALLIFQAFATILVDSGFGSALLREKDPTEKDYSTVFWFNLIVSTAIYAALFTASPLIARIFDNQQQLIPLSKVMFSSIIINGLSIVQVNRLMKKMDVRMIAVSNTIALTISGTAGIILAIKGYGAWALVWQTVILAMVKTTILWTTGHWRPLWNFSRKSLAKIRAIGFSVFSSQLLNTISLNIYNFVIGVFYSTTSLGVYTQADKWSKMGSASISQILTSSFVPLLSKVQNSPADFLRYTDRTARFTAFILLPVMIGLAVTATPLFHLLFSDKWDDAIPLYAILCIRGIFVVLLSLYNNYILAIGHAKTLLFAEILKDTLIFAAIIATIFLRNITILIIGQLTATFITWVIMLPITARAIGATSYRLLRTLFPFLTAAILMSASALLTEALLTQLLINATPLTTATISDTATSILSSASVTTTSTAASATILITQIIIGSATYILTLRLLRVPELTEALNIIRKRLHHQI